MRAYVILTDEQRRQLRKLWFVFGNYGPGHTGANHRYLQELIEHDCDESYWFVPTADCAAAVEAVIKGEL